MTLKKHNKTSNESLLSSAVLLPNSDSFFSTARNETSGQETAVH